MDAEQLFGKATGMVTGAKGTRKGQAARKPAQKGAKFSDTLAALSSGGKKAPAKTGTRPLAKMPPVVAPTTLSPTTPSPVKIAFPTAGTAPAPSHPSGRSVAIAGADPAAAATSGDIASKTDKSRQSARRRANDPNDSAAQANRPAVSVERPENPVAGEAASLAARKEAATASTTKSAGRATEARKSNGTSRRHQPVSDDASVKPAAGLETAPLEMNATAIASAQAAISQAVLQPHAATPAVDPAMTALGSANRKGHRAENSPVGPPAAAASSSRALTPEVASRDEGARTAVKPEPAHGTREPAARTGEHPLTGARPAEDTHAASASRRTAGAHPAPGASASSATTPNRGAVFPPPPADPVETVVPTAPADLQATANDSRGKAHAKYETATGQTVKPAVESPRPVRNDTSPAGLTATGPDGRPSTQNASAIRPADTASVPGAAAEQLAAADKAGQPNAAAKHFATDPTAARETVSTAAPAAPNSGNASGDRHDLPKPGAESHQLFIANAGSVHRPESTFSVGRAADSPAAAPDFAPLHEQVSMRLSTLPDGVHEISLSLSPENLGKLQIDLKISGGQMAATVRADNSDTRDSLLREMPALREALASRGIVLSSFDVSLSGGGNPAEQQAPRQASGWEMAQGNQSRREPGDENRTGGFRPARTTTQTDTNSGSGTHWIA